MSCRLCKYLKLVGLLYIVNTFCGLNHHRLVCEYYSCCVTVSPSCATVLRPSAAPHWAFLDMLASDGGGAKAGLCFQGGLLSLVLDRLFGSFFHGECATLMWSIYSPSLLSLIKMLFHNSTKCKCEDGLEALKTISSFQLHERFVWRTSKQ